HRILQRRTQVAGRRHDRGAELLGRLRRLGRRQIVLERAPQLEADVRRDPAERSLDTEEAVGLGVELVEAVGQLRSRDLEELSLVALGELIARVLAEVAGESARVGTED